MTVILFLLFTLLCGYLIGKWNEDRHIESLIRRERRLQDLPVRNTGKKEIFSDCDAVLVSGGVVVAQDFFKAFVASIVFLFGGRVKVYEALMERARREALLRVKEKAKKLGAKEVVHVRLETSSVGFSSNNNQQRQSSSVEVFCYATALIPKA